MNAEDSVREFRGQKNSSRVPEFRGSLKIDVHRVNRGGRLDLGGFLVLLRSGIWTLGPLASASSTSGLTIRSARRRRLGVRGALHHRQGVGDEKRAELARLTIGVDDRDGAAGLELAVGVVGIG